MVWFCGWWVIFIYLIFVYLIKTIFLLKGYCRNASFTKLGPVLSSVAATVGKFSRKHLIRYSTKFDCRGKPKTFVANPAVPRSVSLLRSPFIQVPLAQFFLLYDRKLLVKIGPKTEEAKMLGITNTRFRLQ